MPCHPRRKPLDRIRRTHQQRPSPVPQGRLALASLGLPRLELLELRPLPVTPRQNLAPRLANDYRPCHDIPDAWLDEYARAQRPARDQHQLRRA